MNNLEISVIDKSFNYDKDGDFYYYIIRICSKDKKFFKIIQIKEDDITVMFLKLSEVILELSKEINTGK